MSLDQERMALTLHNLHAKSVIRMPKHGNPEHVYNVAGKIIAEYDRLTAEWQEQVQSVNLAPSAVPTRNGGGK